MSDAEDKSIDLQLESYRLLVGLVQAEEQLLWSRNQVFLVINGAMVTALGLVRPSSNIPLSISSALISNELYIAICIVGALMNFLWLTMIFRSEAFYNHWFEQLKYLEREYLDPIKIFQYADDYFSKGEITLGNQTFRLPREAKFVKIYKALVITSLGFLMVWIILAGSRIIS